MQPDYGLSIYTAATTTPITIDEALAQLRVDSTEGFPYIRGLVRKAVRFIEETEDRTLVNTVLAVALVGSDAAEDATLLWLGAATVNDGLGGWPAAPWVTELNSATLGTVLTILRRGIYIIELGLTVEASGRVAAAITRAAPVRDNTTNPVNGVAGVLVAQDVITPAACQTGINMEVAVPISDAQIGGGTGIIRFLANNGAGAIIDAGDVIEATARYRLIYAGDLMGG